MHMRIIVSLAALAFLPVVLPVKGNLIINGDFEDGMDGWTVTDNAFIVSDSHAGTRALWLGDGAAAWQVVQLDQNTTYILDFWAKTTDTTSLLTLGISNDDSSQTLGSETFYNTDQWTEFSVTIVPFDTGDFQLIFQAGGQMDPVYLDDSSLRPADLAPVPEPGTMLAGALMLLPLGAATTRMWLRRKMVPA